MVVVGVKGVLFTCQAKCVLGEWFSMDFTPNHCDLLKLYGNFEGSCQENGRRF